MSRKRNTKRAGAGNAPPSRAAGARSSARQAAARYAELLDFAPVGCFVLDPQGLICEVNLAGAALLGLDRRRVTGQPFERYVAPDFQAAFTEFRRSVATSKGRRSCETRLLQHGHHVCDALVEGSSAGGVSGEGRGCRLAVTDITERKRIEEKLRQFDSELERRVAARIAEIQAANDTQRLSRVAALNLAEDAVEARKRAEQASAELRESEQRLELALRISRSFAFEWEPATDRVLRSVSCGAILGLTGDEVCGDTGRRYFQRVHADDRAGFVRMLGELTPANPVYATEYRVVRGDGRAIDLEETAQATFDAAGKLQRLVGVATDITERRAAERARFESTQRLQALMQAVPVGVTFSEDATCQRIFGNPVAAAQLELTVADNLSASAPDAAMPGRQVRYFSNGRPITDAELPLQRAVAENRVIPPMELEVVLPGGRRWFADASAAPVHDAKGNVIAGIAVTVDITGRKRAEQALQRAKEEWERTFDAVPDLIAIIDERHRIVRANLAMARRLGITPGQCVGLICHKAVHGLGCVPGFCPHSLTMADGAEHVAEVRADELGGDFLVSTTPLNDERGRRIGSVHVARDITERKQRERQLQRLNRTLSALKNSSQALMRARGEAEYLEAICRIVVNDCGHAMVWIGLAEEDEGRTVRPVAHAGFEEGYLETLKISWADTELGRGPTGTAIRTGKPCRCANMRTDPNFAPWRAEALKRGYAASLVLPLLARGRAFGAITIYSREPDPFSNDEMELLSELADDLSQGIVTFRLRRAHDLVEHALRQSQERLQLAQQAGRIGAFERNLQTGEVLWSGELEALYGLPPGGFRGSFAGWEESIHAEDRAAVKQAIEQAIAQRGDFQVEFRTAWPDGTIRWIAARGRVLCDAQGRPWRTVGVNMDVTDRRQAEEALKSVNVELEQRVTERTAELHASYRYTRNLIETSLDPLVTINAEGKITDVNRATEEVTGVPRERLIGSDYSDYFTEPAKAAAGYQKVIREGLVRDYPLTIRHATGRTVDVLYHAVVYRDEAGRPLGVFAAARDITERNRMERAHTELLRRLAEAQETERGRISRELHDRLGQDLTALKLSLQMIKKQGPLSPPAHDCLGQVDRLADSLMRDIHRLAWELRPAALDDLGLELALQRYASEWSGDTGVPVDFHSQGAEGHRLPAEIETALYRVTQEALTNVARHARAHRVSIVLARQPGLVSLIVEDDGQGFAADTVFKSSGTRDKLGLLGMQERVTLVRGTIQIESSPGAGASVFVRIPLGSPAPGNS